MKKIILLVTICNLIAAGIGFLTNIILARYFSYEIYGRISLLLSLNAIILTFLQFGFQNSMVIFHNKNYAMENTDIRDFSKLFFVNRQYGKYLLWIGVPVIILFLFITNHMYRFSIFEIFFVGFTPLLLGIYNYCTTFYQAQGVWLKYNVLHVFYNFFKALMLLCVFLIIHFVIKRSFIYDDYVFTFISYAVILFFIGIFISRKYLRIGKHNINWSKLLNKTLIPIGLTNFLIVLIMRIDNVLIEKVLGMKSVAIYSIANTFAFFFPLFTSSIMKVLMKEMSKNSVLYLKKILFYQKKYFIYAIFAFIVVYTVSPHLISFLFGEKYIQSITIFQVLSFVYIGGVFFTPMESYFYTEHAKKIFILRILQLLLVVILGVVFMKLFELPGFAVAVVCSRLVAWIYLYYTSKRIIGTL